MGTNSNHRGSKSATTTTTTTTKWTYSDSEPVPKQWQFNLKEMTWRDKVNFWYLRYLVISGTFMLEPWERRLFDSFVLGFGGMAAYAAYLYLPAYGMSFCSGLWVALLETARRFSALST
ncbi:hypothetical protein BV898_04044 [Hypsibius exemplaris]|uniref:Uncharacterized protein n=1 Tax=Hypsibius exemplaris TaxID=2072580 RepID=A0A1W0X3V4_HYPEX|nr:hypothetical protein BV898_04044 [Hypsibius exemplaris]